MHVHGTKRHHPPPLVRHHGPAEYFRERRLRGGVGREDSDALLGQRARDERGDVRGREAHGTESVRHLRAVVPPPPLLPQRARTFRRDMYRSSSCARISPASSGLARDTSAPEAAR